MPRPIAIPILVRHSEERIGIGTGFLVDFEGGAYLVTAAHVPIGVNAHARWDEWQSPVLLNVGPQEYLKVDLFTVDTFGARRPVFIHTSVLPNGKIGDVMAVLITPSDGVSNANSAHPLLSVYDAVPWRSWPPAVGEHVTAHGYPDRGDSWPPAQSITEAGSVLRFEPGMIRAELDSESGFSGGPVVDEGGALVGMLIGSAGDEEDAAAIVSELTIRELLSGLLR